jgi:hypothetical protein
MPHLLHKGFQNVATVSFPYSPTNASLPCRFFLFHVYLCIGYDDKTDLQGQMSATAVVIDP